MRFRLAIRLLFQLSRYGARITKSQKAGTVWPSNSPPFSSASIQPSRCSRCPLREAITSAMFVRNVPCAMNALFGFAIRCLTRDCCLNHRFTSTSQLLPTLPNRQRASASSACLLTRDLNVELTGATTPGRTRRHSRHEDHSDGIRTLVRERAGVRFEINSLSKREWNSTVVRKYPA